MDRNSIILIVMSLISLIVVRGYMGLATWLVLSKKERKNYKASHSVLSRWFFWSTYRVVKDKYSKYEKRTIRYKTIMLIYRHITVILHCGLVFLVATGLLLPVFESFHTIFHRACLIYLITVLLSIVVLAGVNLYERLRYHKSRYK